MGLQSQHLIPTYIVVHFLALFAQAHVDIGCEGGPNSRNELLNSTFLLYDINPGEGFNLRRDVYMRMAVLVKKLRQETDSVNNWMLVLPPWGPLYHWKSKDVGHQKKIPWSAFFDLQSLNLYIPVLELKDYIKHVGTEIEEVYYLQHYEDAFANNHWNEKAEAVSCLENPRYQSHKDGKIKGWFWGFSELYASKFQCLSIQGTSSTLMAFLRKNSKSRTVMIDRAEVILHDMFGDSEYWSARRSMRYNGELIGLANEFRKQFLNSTDVEDGTVLSDNWHTKKPDSDSALGGPYVSVHLRRQDFALSRPKDVPSIKHAAEQVTEILNKQNLSLVFVATDAPEEEFKEFQSYFPSATRFVPSEKVHQKYKDGGLAIIDQWIAVHARYFIGTHESTFSFRIQEDREILGFNPDTTFNRLCPDGKMTCKQSSRWRIVY